VLAVGVANAPACSGVGTNSGGPALPAGTWIHVAATFDATSAELVLYQRGVEVARVDTVFPTSGAVCDSTEEIRIGNYDLSPGWQYEGWMDELRLWAGVRTQAEVCADAGGIPGGAGGCTLGTP
jgi:hypothetical protein